MAFRELEEFFEGSCILPIHGKKYRVPEPPALFGLKLKMLYSDPEREIGDAEELRLMRELLGPVWDEMNTEGVRYSGMVHAGRTALLWYGLTPEAAKTFWLGGGVNHPLPPPPATMIRRRERTAQMILAGARGLSRWVSGSGTTTSP